LLVVLAGFLLLIGGELYAKRPREDPRARETRERAEFLRTWQPALPIGSPAPNFSLEDVNGRKRSLSEFRGRPTLLCFYSDDKRSRTWAREMQKLRNHIGRSRMESVAVVNFSREAALAFARETGDGSLYLLEDPNHHPVREQYHAAPGPNAWVLDRKGKILHGSAPIHTDRNPDQDFLKVYHALRVLVPVPDNSNLPGWAAPMQRPTGDE
jgi:peroxiredoxin